jgi:hypothetical protein
LPTVPGLIAKAPLNSPTFTGTPTLPTGTIAVTQAAGNNSTALATTAFVANTDATNVKVTGNQTISGAKNFIGVADMRKVQINRPLEGFAEGLSLSGGNPYLTNGLIDLISNAGTGIRYNCTGTGNAIWIDYNTNAGGIPFRISKNQVNQLTISESGALSKISLQLLSIAPASATDVGTYGEIRFTASGIYICTAINTWIKCVGAAF